MKNSYALIMALIALMVGLIAGAGIASEFWSARAAHNDLVRVEVKLMKSLLVLKDFQAGHSVQAKEKLEQQLDYDVLYLDGLKKEHEALEKEPYSSLPSVAEYRLATPFASQDERVTKILKAANERHLTTACTRTREQQSMPDCPSRAGEAGR